MDQDRFCRLWRRCGGADARAAAALFARLDAYYSEPHRHYHTGGHIDDCLARLDQAAAELGPCDSAEMAIWFHDVIYQPGAPDNERRSADWFVAQAGGQLPAALVGEVETYIMDTTHREAPASAGGRLVVDVDLSGLGMAPAMFHRDGDNIRRESNYRNDAEFIRGVGGFLRGLLARERIYYTDFFHDLCEAQARENIGGVLARYPADDAGG